MTKRKNIILIVIAVLVGITIIFLIVSKKQDGDDSPQEILKNELNPVENVKVKEELVYKKPALTTEQKVAASAEVTAKIFVERFGSFTNHNDYLSLTELSPIMSQGFSTWISNVYIPQLKEDFAADGFFYKVMTKAPVSMVVEQNENLVKFRISTQRQEVRGTNPEVSFLQDILITLVKQGDTWLVDEAYWQEKK